MSKDLAISVCSYSIASQSQFIIIKILPLPPFVKIIQYIETINILFAVLTISA